ncbi:glycosyltransferase family 2 protein [Streptomyces sp. NPDC014983]|uniref:glycosyltransferase family 2 protein n=1 Tax=Streptomyces sp. NPDC014983 TaxID=3364933 RepID=UPI0036F5CFD2
MNTAPAYTVVVPTTGRPCLAECLRSLAEAGGHAPHEVIVVDDRPGTEGVLPLTAAGPLLDRVRILRTGGKGPAAARNAGWRTVETPWTVFLDDGVQVLPDWSRRLAEDLRRAGEGIGGIQGQLRVPLPPDRRPTDWERTTKGMENAAWATADMAYRTAALTRVGGFDERFPHVFREDADLALRVRRAGWFLVRGRRVTRHPVRPAHWWASLPAQRGNADDVLMNRLHGRDWWARAQAPRGRLPRHLLVTGAGLAGAGCALAGRPRAAAVCAGLWTLGTTEFALARILPGPRTAREIAGVLATSALIPPLAVRHWLRGMVRHRHARPWGDTG